jgi:hypothetical protein
MLHRNLHMWNMQDLRLQVNFIFGLMVIGFITAKQAFTYAGMVTGTIQRMAGSMYQDPGRLVQRVAHGQMDIGNVAVNIRIFEYLTGR